MDSKEFLQEAKRRLFYYLHPNERDQKPNTVWMFIAWFNKTGQNNKCLMGIVNSDDYFEISYFGDEDKFVLDHYALKKHCLI